MESRAEDRGEGGTTGVLLVNVGSPESPSPRHVRRYLREFLSDPRVLAMPAVARWLLLNLVILPFRPRRSARAYRAIWKPDGSPLLLHGLALEDALQKALGGGYRVRLAMRLGKPSIASGLDALARAGASRAVVFPMFPQYASSTTGSVLEEVYRVASRPWNVPSLAVVPPFYDEPVFHAASAAVAGPVLERGRYDHVLLSFHGLPESHIRMGDRSGSHCLASENCCDRIGTVNADCYRAQCFHTAGELAARLGLDRERWSVSFQSRLGRTPWIGPHTEDVVPALASTGRRRLAVLCPSFIADCLETLEEIGIRARETFLRGGGEELTLVPSLNDHPSWVEAAANLVRRAAGESRADQSGNGYIR